MMILENHLADLIAGCRKADRKAQELLYQLFATKMLGVCLRYAQDKAEAQDMLQNGFIRVFAKLEDYRGDGAFEGWVRRIMIHSSIEYYRKNHKMMQLVEIGSKDETSFLNHTFPADLEAKDLLAMVQSLPPGYRMVFNLYAIEGYSHKEIGEMMQISAGASKSQLSRARAILREMVKKTERTGYENFG